jgi:hypothetical protein
MSRSRSTTVPAPPAPATRWTGSFPSTSAPRIDAIEADLHEMSRALAARIDNKLRLLEQLAATIDRQTVRLEGLLGRIEARLTQDPPAASHEPHSGEPGRTPGPAGTTQLHQAIEGEPAGEPLLLRADTPQQPLQRPHSEIYALADAGRGSDEIAGEVGIPLGEVELILGLRAPRQTAARRASGHPAADPADWTAKDAYMPQG